jgi:hypothetical protein
MVDAALALYQHDIGIGASLQHQPLRGAGHEVGHYGIHGDSPALDHDPGLPGRHEPSAEAGGVELSDELQLGRHLAHVAVGSYREDDVGFHCLGGPGRHRKVGGGLSEVEDLPSIRLRLPGKHGIVAQKRVESAPEIASRIQGLGQPALPLHRQAATLGRYADEDGIRTQGQAFLHRSHHRNSTPEAEDLLHCHPGLLSIQDADGSFRQIADHRIGCLRSHGSEVAIGQDQEARCRHHGQGVTG